MNQNKGLENSKLVLVTKYHQIYTMLTISILVDYFTLASF